MSSGLAPLQVVDGEVADDEAGDEGLKARVLKPTSDDIEPPPEAHEEARQPRLPHNPGRPTKREIAEHCVSHWPFRSWCRHCVCGRAAGSPHKSRSDDDREFGRDRIPNKSLDHCFLGSVDDDEDKKAHTSLFLILFDSETEAIYALAVAEKACKPWIVEYVFNVLNELGFSGVRVAMKSDAAPELQELRRLVAAKRSAPTVPIDVPVRESKANGAVERAVRTWRGQFRTLKSHLDSRRSARAVSAAPLASWCRPKPSPPSRACPLSP